MWITLRAQTTCGSASFVGLFGDVEARSSGEKPIRGCSPLLLAYHPPRCKSFLLHHVIPAVPNNVFCVFPSAPRAFGSTSLSARRPAFASKTPIMVVILALQLSIRCSPRCSPWLSYISRSVVCSKTRFAEVHSRQRGHNQSRRCLKSFSGLNIEWRMATRTHGLCLY
jgi:hypothetical protein